MTNQKQINQPVIEIVGRQAHLFEHISDGILVIDHNQTVAYVNKSAEQLLGVGRAEVVGRPLFEAFPAAKGTDFEQNLLLARQQAPPVEFDTTFRSPAGKNRYYFTVATEGDASVVYFYVEQNPRIEADAAPPDVLANRRVAKEYELVLAAEREQRLIAETLAEVTLALTSQTSLKNVLDEMLRQTQRLVSYRTAHIMLLKDDHLHIAGWQGYRELGSEELVSHLVQPLAKFPMDAEVVRSRQPLVIVDTHQEPRWVIQEQTAWVRSHLVVPICLGERVLGILRLDANTTHAFSEQHVVKLQPLTNVAAIALENARLFEQAQQELAERKQIEHEIRRRNSELALLNQVIAASATSLEPEAILQITCQAVAQTFELPIVSATMLDTDETEASLVAWYPRNLQPTESQQRFRIAADPIFQYLLQTKTSLVIAHVPTDPRLASSTSPICAEKAQSLLVLPLVVEDHVVGSLNLQSTRSHQFTHQEINLAWRVIDQVAGVLARARLDQRHRRLSEAIEQSAESVIITDTAGILVYVNPSFERITGYPSAEVLGKKLSMLKSGRQDAAFYEDLWKTISSGQVWHGRFINKRKDGTLYTDDATISPVRSENGTIVGYVGVQRDVTRELQLEEQYRQAQKMEAVGLLAGGIAHDFNNLLTVINGFAEMIQFELPPDNLHLQKLASRVRYSGTRAAALVRQLLAFSRREFVEPKILNLNKIVTDISKMLERLIEENIALRTEFAPDLWAVKVDAHQIEQIVVNLTVNARDAMPDGGLLMIETENKLLDDEFAAAHLGLSPGRYVLLTVTDSGTGMTDDVKEHLFEPFFTTKEQGKGTGLGLATVFGIVKQYQGAIYVYSEPGKGASFKIYLPAFVDTSEEEGTPEQVRGIPRGTEVVLVVEDEAAVRDLAAYMLRRQGYTVIEAGNGEDALRIAEKRTGKIDLLLTDTVMPKMSGHVLANEFKVLYPDTKILFTSGYTDKNVMRQGMAESGIEFIPKPFSAAELARKVRTVLDS